MDPAVGAQTAAMLALHLAAPAQHLVAIARISAAIDLVAAADYFT